MEREGARINKIQRNRGSRCGKREREREGGGGGGREEKE